MDTLILLYSGRPLAVPEIAGKANALLEARMPGTEGNRGPGYSDRTPQPFRKAYHVLPIQYRAMSGIL